MRIANEKYIAPLMFVPMGNRVLMDDDPQVVRFPEALARPAAKRFPDSITGLVPVPTSNQFPCPFNALPGL
jgi:hypothetical protein